MPLLTVKQYIVDAFTDSVFQGNPAAVCLLTQWLPDGLLQQIAQENNLSETAFLVSQGEEYALRWFTPGGEIDLCGHATLASAYIVLRFLKPGQTAIIFQTKSGPLTVTKQQDRYEMDFPAYTLTPIPVTPEMTDAIGCQPIEAWLGRDLVCVLPQESQVRQAAPELEKVKELPGLLLHLTAQGQEYDCITRSFAPKLQVAEDPVCGSGHCHVIPLWAKKQKKNQLCAFQASQRSGILYCQMAGDRVLLAGNAALYAAAEIYVPLP